MGKAVHWILLLLLPLQAFIVRFVLTLALTGVGTGVTASEDANGNANLQVQIHSRNDYSKQRQTVTENTRVRSELEEGDDVIVVATIDGTFYGLSQSTGAIIWKSRSNSHKTTDAPDADGGTDTGTGANAGTGTGTDKDTQSGNNSNDDNGQNSSESESNQKLPILFDPLLSTTTTRTNNKTWRTAAVPSIDGRVYLTLGNTNNAQGNKDDDDASDTVTNSVRELVDRSPFMDSRGRFFVSNKRAFAVALKKNTGEVLKVVNANAGAGGASDADLDLGKDDSEGSDFVWVGRVDYEVTVHDARTGDLDVQFSTSEVLSVDDMIQGSIGGGSGSGSGRGHDHNAENIGKSVVGGMNMGMNRNRNRNMNMLKDSILALPASATKGEHEHASEPNSFFSERNRHQHQHQQQRPNQPADLDLNPPPLFISTPDGRLAMRNPATGDVQWIVSETFDSPVAYAIESSTGASLGVQIVPDAPTAFSQEYLENLDTEEEMEHTRQFYDGDGNSHDHDHGHGHGHGHASGDVNGGDTNAALDHDLTVFGVLGNGELYALPLGRRSFRNGYGRHGLPHVPRISSTIGSSTKTLPGKLPNVIGDWQAGGGVGVGVGVGVGMNVGYGVGAGAGAGGTADNAVSTAIIPQQCDQSSKNFPECLQNAYVFEQQQKQYLDSIQNNMQLPDTYNQNYGGAKNNFRNILTSWIPPAVALAFVVSFELGRRERARHEAAARVREGLTEKGDNQASTESVVMKRELSDENLASPNEQPGVIHVSEEVLGYGGHGTVVYKGKLDGRFVAVKRMLKAYHASADREISLLIESDGHPNVVRYFLKEVRGDFVYLALELCDMNLQRLIVALSKQRMKYAILRQQQNLPPFPPPGVDPALRKILFEIASGVKHIHSLRIVHRDLKPANILLAKKTRRSLRSNSDSEDDVIYDAYQAEMYLPKISDMGLGKQLAGQSSFGFSTFNTSLGAGLSADQASTVAGAGPGSVGWQAPEVMAQRLSPEAASLDGGSGPESMLLDASPAEISLSGRTSRSVDIFSLGCIFYCTLLPGSHPFGEWYEREANIMKNRPATDTLKDVSMEAWDLVVSMLHRNPKLRPTASQICKHPFFWNASRRLAFFCEFSDRLECDAESNSSVGDFDKLLVECQASSVVGLSWYSKIDPILLNNVQKFRTYDTSSVRDCLRLIRNKHHHFDELPPEFKIIAPTQIALLDYFEEKFPKLLMHCYMICRDHMKIGDALAAKYDIHCSKFQSTPMKKKKNSSSNAKDNILDQTSSLTSTSESTKVNETAALPEVIGNGREPDLDNEEDSSKAETSLDMGLSSSATTPTKAYSQDIISWQGSTAASTLNCRGWIRSEDEWIQRTNEKIKKRDINLTRCAEDAKFRTRLCNHWELSQGTHCPMLKKKKCVFAHGPFELRVKEGKRNRWGRLVDVNGNNSNPQHSGGEDTFGAAMQIEQSRKEEGKWKSNSTPKKKNRSKNKKSPKS